MSDEITVADVCASDAAVAAMVAKHGLDGIVCIPRPQYEAMVAELDEWRSAALYDALMDGPRFKGWNRSQLDRCRKQYLEDKPK